MLNIWKIIMRFEWCHVDSMNTLEVRRGKYLKITYHVFLAVVILIIQLFRLIIYLFPDIWIGHEATGVVCKVGSDVKDIKVGARIAIENHFFCENCYSCNVSKAVEGLGTI